MAWPTTQAGTTNVDSGTDKPSLARADIKQNIDNVNSIIDEFNISSPNDGDLLQYSSTSGQWEQVATSSIVTPSYPTMLLPFGTRSLATGTTNIDVNRLLPGTLITNSATEDRWTHDATGNYIMECYITGSLGNAPDATYPNFTFSTQGGSLVSPDTGVAYNEFNNTTTQTQYFLIEYTVTSTSDVYSFQITASGGNGTTNNTFTFEDFNNWIKIWKV